MEENKCWSSVGPRNPIPVCLLLFPFPFPSTPDEKWEGEREGGKERAIVVCCRCIIEGEEERGGGRKRWAAAGKRFFFLLLSRLPRCLGLAWPTFFLRWFFFFCSISVIGRSRPLALFAGMRDEAGVEHCKLAHYFLRQPGFQGIFFLGGILFPDKRDIPQWPLQGLHLIPGEF